MAFTDCLSEYRLTASVGAWQATLLLLLPTFKGPSFSLIDFAAYFAFPDIKNTSSLQNTDAAERLKLEVMSYQALQSIELP